MYDTVFYQKFLNTGFGVTVLFLIGMGFIVSLCWLVCKSEDKQK